MSMLLLSTACSLEENNAPKMEQTPPKNEVQGTVDTFIQSRVNVLKKARGLEKTLQEAEERRLKTLEGFSGKE
ncbi:MAG TPA: hypothetical protein EYG28_08500 [Nitrospiria bacterium]|nr:hypothetical protein [Candidatus Manganitrophaceae bacterium]HIL35415.1 hypothetical protein [Candidatus Manganitrophaceae bacterium]